MRPGRSPCREIGGGFLYQRGRWFPFLIIGLDLLIDIGVLLLKLRHGRPGNHLAVQQLQPAVIDGEPAAMIEIEVLEVGAQHMPALLQDDGEFDRFDLPFGELKRC